MALIADRTECQLTVRVFRVFRVFRGFLFCLCVLCVLSRLLFVDNRQRGETPRVRGSWGLDLGLTLDAK